MSTNQERSAQPSPGGQGDQRSDLVPGIVRCAKCQFQLVRSNLNMYDGTVTAGDSKTEPCPNGCGPLWPLTWETWAREGWAEAERLHLENAALSAQPSPGGQVEDTVEQLRVQLAGCGVVAMSNTRESLKEQMPDKGAYGWAESLQQVWESVLREIHQRERAEAAEQALEIAASSLPANVLQQIAGFFYDGPYRNPKMVDVMEAALAALQPVGEPFAYGSSAGHQPIPASIYYPDNAACRELYDIPLYAAPPAQAVDLAENMLSVLIEEGVLARNGRVFQKLRALIDSKAS